MAMFDSLADRTMLEFCTMILSCVSVALATFSIFSCRMVLRVAVASGMPNSCVLAKLYSA